MGNSKDVDPFQDDTGYESQNTLDNGSFDIDPVLKKINNMKIF
jgi:hypothetical protein